MRDEGSRTAVDSFKQILLRPNHIANFLFTFKKATRHILCRQKLRALKRQVASAKWHFPMGGDLLSQGRHLSVKTRRVVIVDPHVGGHHSAYIRRIAEGT